MAGLSVSTFRLCGVCVTVNVIAVVKVLNVEGGANGHQLLKPRPRDEQTAGEIEMHQQRESSTLRQTPANTHKQTSDTV